MSRVIHPTKMILVFSLFLSVFSVHKVTAKSMDAWNYFKNHPCTGGGVNVYSNALIMVCGGMMQGIPQVTIPLVEQSSQIPDYNIVYSMTGLEFKWSIPISPYSQDGHLDRFYVSDTEYYENITIHPYLYELHYFDIHPGNIPASTVIGSNTFIILGESQLWVDPYTTTGDFPAGIAVGDANTLHDYFKYSLPGNSNPITGPTEDQIDKLISPTHSLSLSYISGIDNTNTPFIDFDAIHGAWLISTISSANGKGRGIGDLKDYPAFKLYILYEVQMRAWAEPERHFKYETRKISDPQWAWVCEYSSYPIPYPLGCTTPGGGIGFWAWEQVKDSVFKTAWWEIPIDRSTDFGGEDRDGRRLPTDDSARYCTGCSASITSWMNPYSLQVMPYNPIVIFESRPLLDKPW
jgi:hypothetical protein